MDPSLKASTACSSPQATLATCAAERVREGGGRIQRGGGAATEAGHPRDNRPEALESQS